MHPGGVCPICFRGFRQDHHGRLFRHVRYLGKSEVCPGYKFPHAGLSLDGTRWAIDAAASKLAELQRTQLWLRTRPILEGIGPFDQLYDAAWHNRYDRVEVEIDFAQLQLDELTSRLDEWTPAGPELAPVPFHFEAMWKNRPGTRVPLCLAGQARRPNGSPTLMRDPKFVDCELCICAIE